MAGIVIIGAGMAAYALAREFRKREPARALRILAADSAAVYAKPMLSNAFALGKDAATLATAQAAQQAAQLGIEIVPHTTVSHIDCAARCVQTAAGPVAYEALVLALGARPIRPALAGDAADAVLSINHLDDYALFRARLTAAGPAARVLILGAGLIGCEFADDLSAAGHAVTLVDPNTRPLAALAAPALSAVLLQAWQSRSIVLVGGARAAAVWRDGSALQVELEDGRRLGADVVLSAVGLRPALELARAAGLACGRGILVDQFGRTSAPDVYALGDCAEYSAASLGGSALAVLPYLAPMLVAARAIAATLAGQPTAIALPPEPVLVKTAACRLALLPPAPGVEGAWHEEVADGRTVSRYVDTAGCLRGFGLSQPTPVLRRQLLEALDLPLQG